MVATPKKNELLQEKGETGTVIYSGIISNRDYSDDLTGERGIESIEKMRRGDGTVKAALLAVKLPIMSANWYVEAASSDEEDLFIAEFVRDQIFGITRTWRAFLREALSYLDFGYYAFEMIYEDTVYENRQMIGLRKMAPRLPSTIRRWKTEDNQDGITQWTMGGGNKSIPIWKLLVLTNEKEGDNWEGMTMLRSAYKHYYIKDQLYRIDAIGHERQGLGIPVLYKPSNASKKDVADAEKYLKNLRANHKAYAIVPDGFRLEFLDMKAGSTKNPIESIKHHDRQIVKSVLAQFLELGATSGGSYALSEDQSDLFLMSLQSVAGYVADCINMFVINRLVDLNFDVTRYPELKYNKIAKINYDKLTTSLQRLAQTGVVVPDEKLEQYVREAMDLPEKPETASLPDDFGQAEGANLDAQLANIEGTIDMELQPQLPEDEEMQKASEMLMGAMDEEAKKKISEALKLWWSTRKGQKGKKGKKVKNPEIAKHQKEIKGLREEISKFKTDNRRKVLELKSKGEKLTPEETASLQLKMLDIEEKIGGRIRELQNKVDTLKNTEQKKANEEERQMVFREYMAQYKEILGQFIHE